MSSTSSSYFELPDDPVLVCHVLVVVIPTLSSVQVEGVEPVCKVVKIILQILMVHLWNKIQKKSRFQNLRTISSHNTPAPVTTLSKDKHLHLIMFLPLLLWSHARRRLLLVLVFPALLGAFHRSVVRFDL